MFFKDKPAISPTVLQQTISKAKLKRHLRQKIPLDQRDFPVNTYYLTQLKTCGATILWVSKWFNAAVIKTENESCLSCIAHQTFVRKITPVKRLKSVLAAVDYGSAQPIADAINLSVLHNAGFQGNKVKIAVFDNGFIGVDSNHATLGHLFTQGRFLGSWDFALQDSNVFDDGVHGSYVLSIMASNAPGVYVGTAPMASYFLARTEVNAYERHIEEYYWLAAVEVADSLGIDVINSSLGYNLFDPGEGDYTYQDMNGDRTIVTQAADIAASKGMVVVNSAGNEGASPWHYIIAPCDADSILCVGAVDQNGVIAPFSSRGPTADGRIKPDVVAQGAATPLVLSNGQVSSGNGTSFSAPIIAGLAACLIQAVPSATAMQIIEAIRRSGDRADKPDTIYGYGIPNAAAAWSYLRSLTTTLPKKFPLLQIKQNLEQLQLTLFDEQFQYYQLTLYDIQGRKVYQQDGFITNVQYNLPLQTLHPGCYIVEVFYKNQKIRAKWIKGF